MNQNTSSHRGKQAISPRYKSQKTELKNANTGGHNIRPTHFLSLPLHNYEELRSSVSSLTDALVSVTPAISGVHRQLFIKPARLHMTLGVMTLSTGTESRVTNNLEGQSSRPNWPPGQRPIPTVSDALSLLQSLKPDILAICQQCQLSYGRIPVPLKGLHIMGLDKERTHVMWTGPGDLQDDSALWRVSLFINSKFRDSGFITEDRPLKLHCTIANTSFRKPRIPFSYNEVIAAISADPQIVDGRDDQGPPESSINFGTWEVEEIHLCRMGSYDDEGKYVSLGHIMLGDDSVSTRN